MAVSDTPTTFLELRTHFLEVLRDLARGIAVPNTVANRYLNLGLQAMHQEDWWWAERAAVLLTHDDYTTGTLSIALATRTTVTGVSTLWATAVEGMGFNNARAGGKLTVGTTDVYTVSSVESDTSLTLTDRFVGTTALSGQSYTYFEDEYALASDYWRPIDLRYFDADRTIQIIGPQEFYARFARNTQLVPPRFAALIERGPSASVALRPRVVFAPPPDRQMIIPYRYHTTGLAVTSAGVASANLSADTDQPIVPLRWRIAVVYKALELWSGDQRDAPRTAFSASKYGELMGLARQAAIGHQHDTPRLQPKLEHYRAHAMAPYSRRTRRYTTGSRFDRLLD